jgi:hypothetical protein
VELSDADRDLIADSLRIYLDHQGERYGYLPEDEYFAECDRDGARVNGLRTRLQITGV